LINWLDLGPKSNQISGHGRHFALIFPIFFSDQKSRKVMKFKAGRRSVGEMLRDRLDGHHVTLGDQKAPVGWVI